MTVLHILDHSVPLFSGYSFRSRSIVESQRALGLRPIVLTSPKQGSPRDARETIEEVPYYRTGGTSGRLPFLREWRQMVRMAAQIVAVARAEGAHILHAHSPLLNGLPALWAGRRLGLPVVYEARTFWEDAAVDNGTFREGSLRYRISRWLETLVFRRADRVVTICEGIRRDVIARGVAPERVTVIANGVDLEQFAPHAPAAEVAALPGRNGGPVFGFIGSFYHYEGLQFLVSAFPAIRERFPHARLLLVGGGPEERAVRALAAPLGEAVVFAGTVPHENIQDYYSAIDIFVYPRRRMRLTELVTPLKPLEAMAMARPVMASDVGGHAELIRHEETGLLFPAERQDALVAAATRLGADTALARRLGERARAYVTRERAWVRLVSSYPALYAAVRPTRGAAVGAQAANGPEA